MYYVEEISLFCMLGIHGCDKTDISNKHQNSHHSVIYTRLLNLKILSAGLMKNVRNLIIISLHMTTILT